jgi:F0F1-type ATP synthase membrane subunit b/b'
MVAEIVKAMAEEIVKAPWTFLLEIVQFVILVAAAWFLAVGTRERPGMITGRLTGRRQRVAADLEHAMGAAERAHAARTEASDRVKAAQREAHAIKAGATREAHRMDRELREATDAEAARIAQRVDEALATEAANVRQELRMELVEVVAQATRGVLSTSLSIPEQRDLIERAVLAATSPGGSGAERATEIHSARRAR